MTHMHHPEEHLCFLYMQKEVDNKMILASEAEALNKIGIILEIHNMIKSPMCKYATIYAKARKYRLTSFLFLPQ